MITTVGRWRAAATCAAAVSTEMTARASETTATNSSHDKTSATLADSVEYAARVRALAAS
jgi:hypothetical protein